MLRKFPETQSDVIFQFDTELINPEIIFQSHLQFAKLNQTFSNSKANIKHLSVCLTLEIGGVMPELVSK